MPVGIEAPGGALPEDVELLEICDRVDFKQNGVDFVITKLNIASIEQALIDVTYYDNGHPLAGMCLNTIDLAK